MLWVNTEPWFAKHPKKRKHNRKRRTTERLSSYNGLNRPEHTVLPVDLPSSWQMADISVRGWLLFPPIKWILSLPLLLSTLFLSITVTISVCCTRFCRISGTALYLENKAARKRHGTEQKLYPRASTGYKSLHSDNRNIEPQVTENTYCWLHNVWRMRHPWSALDLCIKQHLLAQSNHRENSVLAFSGVTLGHKKVESIWLTANQCSMN